MATTVEAIRKLVTGGDPHARVEPPQDFAGQDFAPAPDLTRIGKALVKLPELEHLKRARIVFLWKAKGGSKRGWIQRCSGLVAYYSKADLVIWIAADNARFWEAWQLEACLFHELCFAELDDKGKVGIRVEDFIGWEAEVARYGAWEPGLRAAERGLEQARQLGLFAEEVP